MDEIKTVAIIGAGALGLLYAGLLSGCADKEVFFIADGERYERLKETVFDINGRKFSFNVKLPQQVETACDLIITAVKNNHLEAVPPLLKQAVSENTQLISVLNGIDSEEFLERSFPEAEVLYAVALGMDAVKEGCSLSYTSEGKLLLGRKNNAPRRMHLDSLLALFDSAQIRYELPEDIHRSIWWKWMINIGVNQVSAVTGATYGSFHTDRSLQQLMDSAMFETIEVAGACGVDLRKNDVADWYPVLYSLGAGGKTSMLQDIEAGRPTEAPWFSGRLIELAGKHGISVPVNETLYRIICVKERLYAV